MSEESDWRAALATGLSEFVQAVMGYLPNLLAGIALLLVGWLLAMLLRAVTARAVTGLTRWLPRLLPRAMSRSRWQGLSPRLAGGLVFWAVMLIFLAAATQVLGLTLFALWLEQAAVYLPILIAAGLIMVIGLIVSQLAREAVIAAVGELEYRMLLGYSVQAAIVVTVVVVGLDLIGLDITLLVAAAAILLGALAGALALAFGLGARTQVSNLLAARELGERFQPGDAIRVGEIEGRVVEFTSRAIVIETTQGHVYLPAKLLGEQPTTLLMREQADE